MKNFSGKQLAGSLFCPALSFLWGLVRLIDTLASGTGFSGIQLFRITFFGAVLIGGVLCTVLTLAFDIHTEYYLEKRLILLFAVVAFRAVISRIMVSNILVWLVLYLLVGIAAYIIMFAVIRDVNTDSGELTVLVLSEPTLYWTICSVMECSI